MKYCYKIFSFMLVIFLAGLIYSDTTQAVPNLNGYIVDAKSKGNALKWAISIEGSGDGKTRPWKEYNEAKKAYDLAITQINKSKPANAAALKETLEKEVNLHIIRAMYYIDAITAGEKITVKKNQLQALINKGEPSETLEKAYHELSAEIRKQGILLDRVYGKSTRDLIRNQFKYSAETVLNSVKYTITIKMKLDEMETALVNSDGVKGTALFNEIKNLMPLAEAGFKVPLQLRMNELADEFQLGDTETPVKIELSIEEIKKTLTVEAMKKGIPPEVLKSIAITENGRFQQFNTNGTPFISYDGGIGIMQVTLPDTDTRYDKERLKYDTRYNIQVGAEILEEKWRYGGKRIPTINNNGKDILENWYFAIMAYNGLSSKNDPLKTSGTVYQKKVYDNMSKYVGVAPVMVAQEELDITYPNGVMTFSNKMIYTTPNITSSTQMYNAGDSVILLANSNLRQQPNTSGSYEVVKAGTEVEIVEGGYEDSNPFNLFTWYKVRVKGTNKTGYLASSNLK